MGHFSADLTNTQLSGETFRPGLNGSLDFIRTSFGAVAQAIRARVITRRQLALFAQDPGDFLADDLNQAVDCLITQSSHEWPWPFKKRCSMSAIFFTRRS